MNEKAIIDWLVESIQKEFNFKTKKQAKNYLFGAMTYNIVLNDIMEQIKFLMENEN